MEPPEAVNTTAAAETVSVPVLLVEPVLPKVEQPIVNTLPKEIYMADTSLYLVFV